MSKQFMLAPLRASSVLLVTLMLVLSFSAISTTALPRAIAQEPPIPEWVNKAAPVACHATKTSAKRFYAHNHWQYDRGGADCRLWNRATAYNPSDGYYQLDVIHLHYGGCTSDSKYDGPIYRVEIETKNNFKTYRVKKKSLLEKHRCG